MYWPGFCTIASAFLYEHQPRNVVCLWDSGPHSHEYEDGCLVVSFTVCSSRYLPTFRRSLLPPSSEKFAVFFVSVFHWNLFISAFVCKKKSISFMILVLSAFFIDCSKLCFFHYALYYILLIIIIIRGATALTNLGRLSSRRYPYVIHVRCIPLPLERGAFSGYG
jgi:hypothetical protein